MPPSPRVRLEVALPAPVHERAAVEATRRGLAVAAWIAETVEVALVPNRCAHGTAAPEAAEPSPAP